MLYIQTSTARSHGVPSKCGRHVELRLARTRVDVDLLPAIPAPHFPLAHLPLLAPAPGRLGLFGGGARRIKRYLWHTEGRGWAGVGVTLPIPVRLTTTAELPGFIAPNDSSDEENHVVLGNETRSFIPNSHLGLDLG